jgi:hypothetical protein
VLAHSDADEVCYGEPRDLVPPNELGGIGLRAIGLTIVSKMHLAIIEEWDAIP